jgi:hypothetical protein
LKNAASAFKGLLVEITVIVHVDETLKKIFGWKRVASGTTFGRFFQKFNMENSTNVFTKLNEWLAGRHVPKGMSTYR